MPERLGIRFATYSSSVRCSPGGLLPSACGHVVQSGIGINRRSAKNTLSTQKSKREPAITVKNAPECPLLPERFPSTGIGLGFEKEPWRE